MAKPRRTAKERLSEEQARTQISRERLTRKMNEKQLQYLNKNLKITKDRKIGARVPDSPSKDFTNYNRREAMAMARQFADENPLAFALLLTNLNFVVGSGFKLSIQTPDKELNRKIEKQWQIEAGAKGCRW